MGSVSFSPLCFSLVVLDKWDWDIYLRVDHQVDRRIDRLIWVAVNFWRGEGWVSACHHCCVVPDDEDAQSLAKVTHHLVLVLAQVPRQMPPLPNLVMVFKPTLCQPPKESTARGRKVMASALHLASYLRSFSLWAWATAESPSSEVLTTKAC